NRIVHPVGFIAEAANQARLALLLAFGRRIPQCLAAPSTFFFLRLQRSFGRRIPQCLAAPSTFFFLRLQRMKLLPPEFARGKRGWFPWIRSAHGHANRVRKSCRAK